MVFTVPVRKAVGGPATRRAVLGGLAGAAAAVALGGCWPAKDKPAARATPHPLAPAVAGTLALIDRYQATMTAYPELSTRLEPLAADHRAHLDALRKAMGTPSPSASATASARASASVAADQAGAIAALHKAEQAGQADAAAACLAAVADYAPVLGSIAACRATHVEVLT
jgi:hypothetical protein